ncbi:B3 domain-containing protein-like protein [Salvia divinorum]|uniref:B3 domain-containing protein-like protein n=1 Tax=Salvia divinorum TaxID=28513 RepID=A0ABD1FTP8_SALDI
MPNGRVWGVNLLKVANGCFFRIGWSEFVQANNIIHLDFLTFTWLGGGKFHVKRYDFGSGCPPKNDLNADGVLSSDEDYNSPDIESSDDYSPPEGESDAESDDDYEEEMMLSGEGEYPTS